MGRRKFLGAAVLAGFIPPPSAHDQLTATGVSSLPQQRQQRAHQLGHAAALFDMQRPPAIAATNADERMAGYIASFSKTLPHNSLGEVDPKAYTAYLRALGSGNASDFEAIPMGATGKLANPQSAYAFSSE